MAQQKKKKVSNKQIKALNLNTANEFNKICTNYITKVTEHNFDYEAKEVEELYIKYNLLWKAYSRKIINRYLSLYNTQARRIDLITAFETFVRDLKNPPTKDGVKKV